MCHEQWALTVIKLLRFFCINQNQECVNILRWSVTFYEYKNVVLMLLDNVCTIHALFVTEPLH